MPTPAVRHLHGTPEPTPSDPGWEARIRAGDPAAFEAVFRQHSEALCRFVARMVGSPECAEEIVQDVLLRLWQQREQIEVSQSLVGYLYGAARNGALMHLRRRRLEERWQERAAADEVPSALGERPPLPDEWARSSALASAIQEAIQKLPPRCREAYLLRREHHLSYAEIAGVMGISLKTVEVQIGAALRSLRGSLRDWWD